MTIVTNVMTCTYHRALRSLIVSTGNRGLLQPIYCSYNRTYTILLYKITSWIPWGHIYFEHNNFLFHKYITYWNRFTILHSSCIWYVWLMLVLIAGGMTTLVSNTGSSQGNYDYWLRMSYSTFSNTSVISLRPCLLLEKTRVLWEINYLY